MMVDIILITIVGLFILSLIDRWFFRKVVVKSKTKIKPYTYKITGTAHFFFNIFKINGEYLQKNNRFYTISRKSSFNTTSAFNNEYEIGVEVEPRFLETAVLKYELEQDLNQ